MSYKEGATNLSKSNKIITLEYLIIVHIKRSHSIHMFSIQIDTKSLELFNNTKLSFFASHMKSSFPLCTSIRYSRVLPSKQTLKDSYPLDTSSGSKDSKVGNIGASLSLLTDPASLSDSSWLPGRPWIGWLPPFWFPSFPSPSTVCPPVALFSPREH